MCRGFAMAEYGFASDRMDKSHVSEANACQVSNVSTREDTGSFSENRGKRDRLLSWYRD